MRQYDVYALGNALVDLEYAVEDADLVELALDKGVMTLVDEAQQARIMAHLHAHPHRRGAGGSAANSVIALAQLGGRGAYSCKVADDELGQFYLNDLIAGGIATRAERAREPGDTGRCVVLTTPDSERTMCTCLGISNALSVRDIDREALRAAEYFYTESYLTTSPSAHAAVIEARTIAEQAGVKTALSLSDPNIVKYFSAGVRELIGAGLDLVFANEAEALGMAATDDLQHAVAFMRGIARVFAITRGPRGALVYDGRETIDIAPVPVTAVDSVGAGDMFAGAFLYGLTQGWSHRQAGSLAAAAAAKLVTTMGPRLSRAETQAVLKRIATD